jgi:hypothetical protein
MLHHTSTHPRATNLKSMVLRPSRGTAVTSQHLRPCSCCKGRSWSPLLHASQHLLTQQPRSRLRSPVLACQSRLRSIPAAPPLRLTSRPPGTLHTAAWQVPVLAQMPAAAAGTSLCTALPSPCTGGACACRVMDDAYQPLLWGPAGSWRKGMSNQCKWSTPTETEAGASMHGRGRMEVGGGVHRQHQPWGGTNNT